MNYKRISNKILLSLQKGDEIFNSINKVIDKEKLTCGWISGLGAFENILLGAYPLHKKDYIKKKFEDEYEITSLVGNISIKEGEPFIHIHVTMSDMNFKAYGGHLFSAYIAATCEIMIEIIDYKLYRSKSEKIGLHLWDLSCG